MDNSELRFIFVGEQRSDRAIDMKVRWGDGRLCDKPLREALQAAGLDLERQVYRNLWMHPRDLANSLQYQSSAQYTEETIKMLNILTYDFGLTAVALGNKVARELTRREVPHFKMVHPAARGAIRKTVNYRAHVAHQLQMFVLGKGVNPKWLK